MNNIPDKQQLSGSEASEEEIEKAKTITEAPVATKPEKDTVTLRTHNDAKQKLNKKITDLTEELARREGEKEKEIEQIQSECALQLEKEQEQSIQLQTQLSEVSDKLRKSETKVYDLQLAGSDMMVKNYYHEQAD